MDGSQGGGQASYWAYSALSDNAARRRAGPAQQEKGLRDTPFVPVGELLALVDDVPAARRHVLVQLARQLRDQQDDLICTSFADAATRTAAWLTRAAVHSGRKVVLPGAQQGLAESIGVTRVSVNRALRTLVSEGLIRVEPGAVVILAPELLARRASAQR